MKRNRIAEIEASIQSHKILTNEQLCNMFDISMQTLRRDIKILEDKGTVAKVYGGVVAKDGKVESTVSSLTQRLSLNHVEKQKIGELAATLVEEEDVIFLDSGTTVCRMLPYLKKLKHITIITHSLDVISELVNYPNITSILLGGQLNTLTSSFQFDVSTMPYVFTKSFIATVGIDNDGCTNIDLMEGRIKQCIIAHSQKSFLLADSSKFNVTGYNRFATLEQFYGLITDQKVSNSMSKVLKEHNVKAYF